MIPKRINIGEQLRGFPAATWNWMIDRIIALEAGAGEVVPPAAGPTRGKEYLPALVRNTTGQQLKVFSVLSVTNPHPEPREENDPNELLQDIVFDGVLPRSDRTIVVTQQPLAAGDVGECALMGATYVRLNATDETREAAIIADDPTMMESGAGFPIIWRAKQDEDATDDGGDPTGGNTGEQWAKILIGGSVGSSSSVILATVGAPIEPATYAGGGDLTAGRGNINKLVPVTPFAELGEEEAEFEWQLEADGAPLNLDAFNFVGTRIESGKVVVAVQISGYWFIVAEDCS